MFKEMRRSDRKLDDKGIVDILNEGEYGVLSTIGKDGYPYGVPVNYTYKDDTIYIHCAKEGHKLENIRYKDKVSFTVVGKTEIIPDKFSTKYESVVAFGRASDVNGDEKTKALVDLIEKYSPDYLKEGKEYINKAQDNTKVIKVDIVHVTGKAMK